MTPDDTAARLQEMVEHLALIRDRGYPKAGSIAEQRAWREGISAAMRTIASTALLVTMDDEPSPSGRRATE